MNIGLKVINLNTELSNYLKIALDVLKIGIKALDSNIDHFNYVESENDRDIKVRADRELHNILIEELKHRSTFNILSEEGKDNTFLNNEYNWILDPLDGSFNYYRGIPFYCISIGLWKGLEPVLGVIGNVPFNEIYYGVLGDGARKNEKIIKVSKISHFSNAVLTTGFPINYSFSKENIDKFFNNIKKYKKVRLFGSAAMSLSLLASGKVDVYSEENIFIWDVAAGISIVMAAGGKVIFRQGDFVNTLTVFASNGALPVTGPNI